MACINRVNLINYNSQYTWVCAQAGFGKTTLLKQHYEAQSDEKLWLDPSIEEFGSQYLNFTQNNDCAGACLYIDDIHCLDHKLLSDVFTYFPKHANVIISSRAFNLGNSIELSFLNKFDVINYQQLRLNYTQIKSYVGDQHPTILTKDLFSMTLGWPILIAMIKQKLPFARDYEHLTHLLNAIPYSLSNYCEHHLLNSTSPEQREFLMYMALTEHLPKTLFSPTEQCMITDFCEHELSGFTVFHSSYWQILPILKNACSMCFLKLLKIDFIKCHSDLAERFIENDDIESAIKLMLKIGRKDRAIYYLNKMGGLLNWIQHGLTNLMSLHGLFTVKDAEQYESVAWLECIINYKLGHVSQSRRIVNDFWQRHGSDQLTWTVADAMIKLHEGRVFDASHLERLNNFSKSDALTGPFTRALINNLLAITWLQSGENIRASTAINEAKKQYTLLNDARYGVTFINIHLCHSLILSCQFDEAKTLLNRTQSEIQTYFNKDKSIRLSQQIIKLELNYLNGLVPAVRTLDSLIKKLKNNESWFDLYAILYPIAIKVALLRQETRYIKKWFVIASSHHTLNPMAHLDELLSYLSYYVIQRQPELKNELELYCVPVRALYPLPWRLQILVFELDKYAHDIHYKQKLAILRQAKKNNNIVFYLLIKLHLYLLARPSYLPLRFITQLKENKLIGVIWYVKEYIPKTKLDSILRQSNRLNLYELTNTEQHNSVSLLSDKEQRVMALLDAKLRNKQIAIELDISEQTVKFHLKNIYRKLGVKSRKEAVLHNKNL